MTTRRTLISRRRKVRITPEALSQYILARKLYDTSKVDEWGMLSVQCREACSLLHELLGRTAGELDVLDTIGCETVPTEMPYKPWNDEDWEHSAASRRELERLAEADQ